MVVMIMENHISESAICFEWINPLLAMGMLAMGKRPCCSSLIVTLFDSTLFTLPFRFDNDRKDGSCC